MQTVKDIMLDHLANVQMESCASGYQASIQDRLGFLKWLVNKHPNTEVMIDGDQSWKQYQAELKAEMESYMAGFESKIKPRFTNGFKPRK